MPLTSAEKQDRYRERHLGADGSKERLQLFISVACKGRLIRLAQHYRLTLTEMVESLIAAREKVLLETLPANSRDAYLKPTARLKRYRPVE